ncbi:hypothetical protein OR1_02786 [Geobacter sp. OR-1]|uniref:hypothetical protein n=1 Tax=Geobacter sp. OR-1 TaxID=1266765 RepID=UPI000541FD81|nr:hypothetical protein [Geobacter sp. OR-1]GAM10497.1 hypothetical protein OR1_02786 [Geobacter sp. OR-1]
MNIEQMKTVLREMVTKTDLTPCVVGHRGVGKTAGIIQVSRDINYRYVPLRLGQMEVGDLVGIPYREGGVMHWSRPSWWPTDDDPPTLIHCDELNRAQQEDTLQAIFQFVEPPNEGQQRALHTHKLHHRHRVVVTINPPDGTYQVAPLDRALIDRMVMLYVETDYTCWARYARNRGLDKEVQQFMAVNPGFLAKGSNPMEMLAEPSERGWEMVSRIREQCRFPQELATEVCAGVVGQEAAIAFLRWCAENRHRPVAALELLDNWPKVVDRVRDQRDDLQAATMNGLVELLRDGIEMTPLREEHLIAYIDILPRDLRFALVKSLLKIPSVAALLAQDRYDGVVLEAIRGISAEA